MKIRLTEEIWKEGNMYVSYCPELDISSCSEDVQQAKKISWKQLQSILKKRKRWGHLSSLLELLERFVTPGLGCVFNGVEPSHRNDYYYYNYYHYYDSPEGKEKVHKRKKRKKRTL